MAAILARFPCVKYYLYIQHMFVYIDGEDTSK